MPKKDQQDLTTTVYVDYRVVGDWHVFTSHQVRGLYVAHADQRTAYEAIGPTIETLLAENERIEVKVRPALAFDAFLEMVRSEGRAPTITPGTSQPFMVMSTS